MSTKSILSLCLAVSIVSGCAGAKSSGEVEEQPASMQPSDQALKHGEIVGEFVIVDARMASDVASPILEGFEPPIGESITFTQNGIELEDASCDDWLITELDETVLPVENDPNLIDLILGPSDSPITSGDQQIHLGYSAICEGEPTFIFHKVDDRVLVMPTANSAVNLILERPLTETQVKAYQAQLKSMKFYDGDVTGQLDEATLRSSRVWFEYRAELGDTQPIPARPAITENLLDALSVLNQAPSQE